jgi:hypothetical protein
MIALLVSCQPLPHPFADDRPPAELLRVPESAGVAVAPVEGQPPEIAAKLGGATARALLGHEIPASEKTTGRGSYQLYGRVTQSQRDGKAAIAVVWRLENARGQTIGERGVGIEASPQDWRDAGEAMIERLAALSADAVAPLLVKDSAVSRLAALAAPLAGGTEAGTALAAPAKPPLKEAAATPDPAAPKPADAAAPAAANPARPPEGTKRRVALRRVTGAPGDGATALARALTGALRQQNLAIVEPGDQADFHIEGEVSVTPVGPDTQHVKIVWRVRSASGAELGNVGQENDVPRGLLSGRWGDVAYVVASAAAEGLLEIFARAPPPAAADVKAGPDRSSGGEAPQPATSPAKPGKAKGKS